MNTKNIALAATLLLASAGAQAATFTPVGNWDSQGSLVTSFPTYLDIDESCAQNLLTEDVLSQIAVTYDTAKGTANKAAIKSMTFTIGFIGYYFWDGDGIDFEVTVENTDATSFPYENSKYQFLPYGNEGSVTTTYTFDSSYDDPTGNLDWDSGYSYDDCDVPVTITFDPPLVYNGGSLLLTWKTTTRMEGDTTAHWWSGGHCSKTSYVSSLFNKNLNPTGQAASSMTNLPVLLFDYDIVEEEIGGGESGDEETITKGDPTTAAIAGYDSPKAIGDNYYGPICPGYEYSRSQILYTADMLTELYHPNSDGSMQKAEITSLSFLLTPILDDFFYGGLDITMYIENTDETTFTLSNGKYLYLPYSTAVKGTLHIDEDYEDHWADVMEGYYSYNDEDEYLPVTIEFDTPLTYEGQSLLITTIANSELISSKSYWGAMVGVKGSMTLFDGNSSNEYTDVSGKAGSSFSFVPSIELGYTPLTISSGTKPNIVSFENVTLGFGKTADGSYNYIKADFDLVDDANCGPYTIKVGTKEIGTITEKQGTITYIDPSMKQNMLITVLPAGKNSFGQPDTIAAADVAALFTAPVVKETLATSMVGSFEIMYDKSVELSGAFLLDVEIPAAPVTAFSAGQNSTDPKVLYGSNDNFGNLIPAGATDYNAGANVAVTNGKIALSKNKVLTLPVSYGVYETAGKSANTFFTPSFNYPMAYAATPTLGTAPASVSTTTIKAPAKSSYSVKFDAEKSDLNIEIEYLRNDIQVVTENGNHIFYYPLDHTMYYAVFTPGANENEEQEAPAQVAMFRANKLDNPDGLEYKKVETPALVLPVTANQSIHVYTEDASGEFKNEAYRYTDEDGNISGIADVVAGQSGEVEFYNLQGVKVDTSNLTPGIYVARRGTTATKVVVR